MKIFPKFIGSQPAPFRADLGLKISICLKIGASSGLKNLTRSKIKVNSGLNILSHFALF